MILRQQINAAKRCDLPRILKEMGVDLIAEGQGYHLREHDSLKLFQQNGIWLYKWWSRDGEVGDGIDYLQRYFRMDFREAVEALAGPIVRKVCQRQNRRPPGPIAEKKVKRWTSTKWHRESRKLIRAAQGYLFGPNGKERISYLVNERGLNLDTICRHHLGWLPAKGHMSSKLLIPCYDNRGDLIRIRFRIDEPGAGQERYRIRRGSNPHSPFPLGISPDKPVVVVESELDAILISQQARDYVGVLAMGTTGMKLSDSIIDYLNEKIPIVLISLDNDQSGRQKTDSLMSKLPKAIGRPVPEKYGKDPGEAWKQLDIEEWIEAGLRAR